MGHNAYWEANSRSATNEIPRVVGKPKVRYHVRKNAPLGLVFGYLNPFQAPTFFRIHLSIFSHFRLSFSSGFALKFCDYNFAFISSLSHSCYTSCSCHSPWYDYFNNKLYVEDCKLWSSLLPVSPAWCCFLS